MLYSDFIITKFLLKFYNNVKLFYSLMPFQGSFKSGVVVVQ